MTLPSPSLRPRACLLALLGLLGPSACETDPRGPLDLDTIIEPDRDCVVVDHEALSLGDGVHAFVADGPDARGGWALISQKAENQVEIELAIVRVPGNDDEPETPTVPLGLPPFFADEVELRAGLEPGRAWLLLPGVDALSLHAFAVGVGLVASNDMLSNFPADDGSGGACPGSWQRQLLLIEGRPFVFALPDCSDGPALDLELLEIDPSTLGFVTSWELSFDPCALSLDPEQCAELAGYTLEDIGPGGSTPLPGASRVSVAFSQVRVFHDLAGVAPDTRSSDISVLDLRLTADGPDARLLTFREVWVQATPLPLGQVTLAQDPYSIQLHVRSQAYPDDEALFRLDTIRDVYTQTTQSVPLPSRGKLIQLAGESAMMTVDDQALLAVPLIDIQRWPQWRELELAAVEGLLRLEPAGPGHLLLRRSDADPQIVRVRCLE